MPRKYVREKPIPRKIPLETLEMVRFMIRRNDRPCEIVRRTGVTKMTVWRIKQEMGGK